MYFPFLINPYKGKKKNRKISLYKEFLIFVRSLISVGVLDRDVTPMTFVSI